VLCVKQQSLTIKSLKRYLHGRDCLVVRFTSTGTYAISDYHYWIMS